jgi:hypothetical protein
MYLKSVRIELVEMFQGVQSLRQAQCEQILMFHSTKLVTLDLAHHCALKLGYSCSVK